MFSSLFWNVIQVFLEDSEKRRRCRFVELLILAFEKLDMLTR